VEAVGNRHRRYGAQADRGGYEDGKPVEVTDVVVSTQHVPGNGGNLLAARMALEDGIAANVGQGFHHARFKTGAGYCTFNGLALVAALNPELQILVIDCDEHAGDGTAELTARIPNLTNFSVCGYRMGCSESDRSILRHVEPHDVNAYGRYLTEVLEYAASTKPTLVIYQAGMDPHEDDPLG